MAKEIMKTHDTVFYSRPKSTAANIVLDGCQDVLFAPYGEYWRQVRKVCVVELLSLKRVKQFHYAMEDEVAELVNRVRRACLSDSPVNLGQMLITTTSNIMSRCILGDKFIEDGDWFGEISRRIVMQIISFSLGDYFPCLKWIDTLRGFISSLKATNAELDKFFDHLIEEHKKDNYEDEADKDFIDILIQLQKDAVLDFELTSDNLKAIIQDMFLAGSDTSSTTMERLMAELGRNPNVMEKLQEEIRRVVGRKARVDVNDITKMHYLKCVLRETLRLHPAAPLLVPRETTKAVELAGYNIPAKTRVIVNAFAIQRDPRYWEMPDEFLPERFEGNSVDFLGEDFHFIPFGGARRGCPGQAFDVASIEYVLANLLYLFNWKLPCGSEMSEALDMSEICGITIHKKSPLHLIPVAYSP